MKHTVTLQQGQTLADIAIQEYGTIEVLMDIAILNGLGADASLPTGTVIRLPDLNPEPRMAERVKAQAIQPATDPLADHFRIFAGTFDKTFA